MQYPGAEWLLGRVAALGFEKEQCNLATEGRAVFADAKVTTVIGRDTRMLGQILRLYADVKLVLGHGRMVTATMPP